MSVHRRTIVATAVVAVLTLSACSAGSSGGPSDSNDDSVRIALTAEPQNLDFTTTGGAPIPQLLMTNVYEGLVFLDPEGEIQPALAESWEISDDRKTYDFTLQEDVTFSNGEQFTAEDVKASIERVQNEWALDLKKKMGVVESVEVVSPIHARVNLSRPSNAWLFDMGTSIGAMMWKDATELATEAIGTGPYQITEIKRGQSISLEARDNYWGEAPAISDVILRYYGDAVATTNALRAGDVDLIYNLGAPDLIDSFEQDGSFTVQVGDTNREIMLSMNNKRAPFDDVRVRQAVRYAIDNQAVIDTAWAGYGKDIGSLVPPHDPYYEDLTDMYPYDPAKARQLLKDANAENIDVTWKVPTLPYATASSEIVVSLLADVGINVTIETTEFPAVWLDQVWTQADYEMSVIGTAEARDILITFNDSDFYTGYDNSKIKDIATAADAGSEEEYIEGMKEIARTISEDAAAEFLFLYPLVSVSKVGLEGVQVNEITEALTLKSMHWTD